jgi:hypothetical protein
MPKVKVVIDPDVEFAVVAWAEAFGFQAAVGVRLKKINQGSAGLSDETIRELPTTDYSEPASE